MHGSSSPAAKVAGLMFLASLVTVTCAAQQRPWPTTAAVVVGHLIGMALAIGFASVPLSSSHVRSFSLSQLFFATLGVAIYLSLLAWLTRSVPWQDVKRAGWIWFSVLAVVIGWTIATVLADLMSGLVWYVVHRRLAKASRTRGQQTQDVSDQD